MSNKLLLTTGISRDLSLLCVSNEHSILQQPPVYKVWCQSKHQTQRLLCRITLTSYERYIHYFLNSLGEQPRKHQNSALPGFWVGNRPVISEILSQITSNVEKVSMSWWLRDVLPFLTLQTKYNFWGRSSACVIKAILHLKRLCR